MILFLGGVGVASRIIFNGLAAAGLRPARAIIEAPVPRSQLIRRRAAKLGWRRVAGQVAFQALAAPLLAKTSRRRVREVLDQFGLSDAPIPADLLLSVPSVNAPQTLSLLLDVRPTVVVVSGTRIISRRVLEQVPATFVNLHAGITPTYRGVHGAYWALAEGRPEACGVTVHLVDAGIDTGGVLARATIQPGPRDNFATYPYLQLAAGIPLLVDAVRALEAGRRPAVLPHEGDSALRHHPGLLQYCYHRLTRGVR